MSACHYCQQEEGTPIPDSDQVIELRPYGPGGADVCFDCGTSPEHKEETMVQMGMIVKQAMQEGKGIVITDKGIRPA
jgi:hypothetical protein